MSNTRASEIWGGFKSFFHRCAAIGCGLVALLIAEFKLFDTLGLFASVTGLPSIVEAIVDALKDCPVVILTSLVLLLIACASEFMRRAIHVQVAVAYESSVRRQIDGSRQAVIDYAEKTVRQMHADFQRLLEAQARDQMSGLRRYTEESIQTAVAHLFNTYQTHLSEAASRISSVGNTLHEVVAAHFTGAETGIQNLNNRLDGLGVLVGGMAAAEQRVLQLHSRLDEIARALQPPSPAATPKA